MADTLIAFGLAANIAQIVATGLKVVNRISSFHSRHMHIPTTLQQISDQLPVMIDICEQIRGDDRTSNTAIAEVVKGCVMYIGQLDALTKGMLPANNDTMFQRTRRGVNSIRLENRLVYLQRVLESYRTSLLFHSEYISCIARSLGYKPKTLHCFPLTPSCQFVERVEPLQSLHGIFSAKSIKHARPRVAILHGMGG